MPLIPKLLGPMKSKLPTATKASPPKQPPTVANAAATAPTNTMNIQLQNRTQSSDVFAYITGLSLENNNHPCLIKADGKTPYYPSSPAQVLQPLSENCSIKLGDPGSITTVTIPELAGGRIWFALGKELKFLINPGPAIVEPSISNPSDPNMDLEWDFCEFTFANGLLYANISYVDFVSLSISLTLTPTEGDDQKVLGLKPEGLQQLVDGLQSQNSIDGTDWDKLVHVANGKPLRVLSPNNAIVMAGGNLFQGYYDSYVNQVFDMYTTTPLAIDTQAHWGQVNGQVSSNAINFPGLGSFGKPSTADIFSCSSGPFADNAGALGPLTARICAGFNRSTLLNDQVHPNAEKVNDYYKTPITNHYARLVHEANIDRRGYAFPYDDVPAGGGGIDQSGRVRTRLGENQAPRARPPQTYSQSPSGQSVPESRNNTLPDPPEILRAATQIPTTTLSQNVSPELSTRLLQTYFNCLHPLWPILYKPLYNSLDYASPSAIMPPALVAAIFSIASCVDRPTQYVPKSIMQKYPEPGQFLQDALDILQSDGVGEGQIPIINALKPTITSCQVLTILALQQHGVAEYARAAMLCSLAAGMAIDLRLHRASELDNPIQAEIKSRLWWNLYILEKLIATDMGKPIFLRAEEADCPYPSVDEADEFELMSCQAGNQVSLGLFRNTSIKLRTISGLHSTIGLSKNIEKMSREVYGIAARRVIRENRAAGEAKRMEIWGAFQQWEKDMEASPLRLDLSKDLTSVPAAVTNYVINWHATILLHRPFIARWSSNPASAEQTNPFDICLESANNICIVLEKYFDRLLGLPCDMVFSVFTAASTLLYHSKNSKESDPETQRRLRLCIRWLSVLGKSWKSAGARQQMLADMFDLPPDLRNLNTHNRVLRSPSPEEKSGKLSALPASDGHQSSHGTETEQSPENWGFLRDFGDATDEFFELDVQLLGLLDGGIRLDHVGFG
ncbi:transcription factor Cys [Marssonina coronariae]|uniref:Transcription factor Cys n=1 Tax=Diplocarpon coronariae TaxID=2795749 RepID=A0A218YVA9_9HELO|nr:transcription factor Cys [Marssonina coronariae]